MSFVIDNILYLLNFILLNFPYQEKKIEKLKADIKDYTALIPIKHEKKEVLLLTIRSLNRQIIKPKQILLLISDKDVETIEECRFYSAEQRVLVNNCSKADALKQIRAWIDTHYVLVIDAGDELGSPDYTKRMMYQDCEVAIPLFKPHNGNKLSKFMMKFEFVNWFDSLKRISSKFGFCPLPGTGLMFNSSFFKSNPFPETLAEDAALGFKVKKPVFSDVTLKYNLPPTLVSHLKQRGRWNAGFIQNLKYARTKFQKWLCFSPIFQAIVPISLILLIPSYFLGWYNYIPFLFVDISAFFCLIFTCLYLVIKFRSLKLFLIPFWWFLTGLSAWIGFYYFYKRVWYCSPKSTK